MKIGIYDETKAKEQAKLYLAKSIKTLSSILGLDLNNIDINKQNPYQEGTHLFAAYNCLINEIKAYNKIVGESNE